MSTLGSWSESPRRISLGVVSVRFMGGTRESGIHLRSLVVLGADKGRQAAPAVDGRAAKVGDTDPVSSLRGDREEDVLRLQIAVNEAAAVDVLQSSDNLSHYPLKLLVFKLEFLLQE